MKIINNKKVAIITGGSRGIGFECAKKLANEGYNLAICSRSKKELKEAFKSLEGQFREYSRFNEKLQSKIDE